MSKRLVTIDEFRKELHQFIQKCPVDTSEAGGPFWIIKISPTLAHNLLTIIKGKDYG